MQVGKYDISYFKQYGFTMLAVLAAMFLSALAANTVMQSVSQQDQREREAQLIQIGQMYRQAIKDYYEMSPGAEKQWPKTLEDLTHDVRFVDLRRHLRETNGRTGISGVYSKSTDQPLNTARLSLSGFEMPSITQYAERRFEYIPHVAAPLAPPSSAKASI
jgi:type II secretory pathway pseudopilin PulG